MREGRREKRSSGGGRRHGQSPSPSQALDIRSLLRGQGLPRSLPYLPPTEGRGGQRMLRTAVLRRLFPKSDPHRSIAKKSQGETVPKLAGSPRALPEAAGGGRKSGRLPRTYPARHAPHVASAAFGLIIIPCSPAGRGRCHGLARGGELAGLETRNYSVFGLGNVFLMSHIMFFKLCWNH